MTLKISAQDMADAIVAANGMITSAAKRLGCTPQAIYKRRKSSRLVQEAFERSRATLGDRIETTLLDMALGRSQRVQRTNPVTGEIEIVTDWVQEPNITALIFLAKTHPAMRERGYGEKRYSEHTGKDGGALEINITYTDDEDASRK